MYLSRTVEISRLHTELRRQRELIEQLSAQVAELSRLAGIEFDPPVDPLAVAEEEMRLVTSGRRSAAIRRYCARTGASPEDAEAAIAAAPRG